MKKLVIGSLLAVTPLATFADGSPWLLNPGSTTINLSHVDQEADEFYLGEQRVTAPGNGDVTLKTTFLTLNHGLTDNLAADLRIGYAKSDTAVTSSDSDFTDSTLGLTYRLHDEFLADSALPSIAVRVAATLEGDYQTSSVNAIGDGASGVEASLIAGKLLNSKLAVSGDLGYRYRTGDVDNEILFNLNATYFLTPELSAGIAYHLIDSQADLDIGGPGFSPSRFDEVEEDSESIELNLGYTINPQLGLNLGYAEVIDGRNTADNRVLIGGVTYRF